MNIKKLTTAAALVLAVGAVPMMAKPVKGAKGKKAERASEWNTSQRAQFEQQFSRYDRNRDGAITRSEFPADLALFNRLDLNRDGAVTRGEVEQAFPNRAAVENEVRAYDRNGDGMITRNEFPGDSNAFSRLDRNRDGVLTNADRNVRNTENGQMRFRGMDRNGDGVITRGEWRGNDNSFRQHDRNGDGILSGSELRGNGRD